MAWWFKQFFKQFKQSREEPQWSHYQVARGFTAHFCSFAIFLAASNCLNHQATQAKFYICTVKGKTIVDFLKQ